MLHASFSERSSPQGVIIIDSLRDKHDHDHHRMTIDLLRWSCAIGSSCLTHIVHWCSRHFDELRCGMHHAGSVTDSSVDCWPLGCGYITGSHAAHSHCPSTRWLHLKSPTSQFLTSTIMSRMESHYVTTNIMLVTSYMKFGKHDIGECCLRTMMRDKPPTWCWQHTSRLVDYWHNWQYH